jgi:Macrocin-O-methyltransferase (TylF)
MRVARYTPQRILNSILLTFPSLYRTGLVMNESFLGSHGIDDLLTKLSSVRALEGDVIECGSARCGTSVTIGRYLQATQSKKKIYALDLFGQGFDLDELRAERIGGLTHAKDNAFVHTSYDYVTCKIHILGLSDTVIPVKGYFQDTLPGLVDSKRFCLALIDCDLKKSTTYCAESIWPKLSGKGVMLFDDYDYDLFRTFKGPKIAVDEFVNKHSNEISDHGFLNRLYYVRKKNSPSQI